MRSGHSFLMTWNDKSRFSYYIRLTGPLSSKKGQYYQNLLWKNHPVSSAAEQATNKRHVLTGELRGRTHAALRRPLKNKAPQNDRKRSF
jgi:hypothetical protein